MGSSLPFEFLEERSLLGFGGTNSLVPFFWANPLVLAIWGTVLTHFRQRIDKTACHDLALYLTLNLGQCSLYFPFGMV